MTTATAKWSFEIEIELEATMTAPSGDGWNESRDPGGPEDVAIVELGAIQYIGPQSGYKRMWETTSLLTGVDLKSPDIQRFFANILAHFGTSLDGEFEVSE